MHIAAELEPERVELAQFFVFGRKARTSNGAEFNPITAKIPVLWGQFLADKALTHDLPNIPVYGVYSDYTELGMHGDYTVTAGVSLSDPAKADSMSDSVVRVQGGDYLVFSAKGLRPLVVIQAWQQIWSYFAQNPQIKRRYATDFELYSRAEGQDVEIYIGVVAL
jgi:predicted transcriptional regulator YdeE